MFYSLSTLLRILAASAASLPFVAAQAPTPITTDELYGNLVSTAAPAPGFNGEGGSVFTNFVNAVNNKQFFFLATGTVFLKSLGRNLRNSLILTGAAISPFPTSTIARL